MVELIVGAFVGVLFLVLLFCAAVAPIGGIIILIDYILNYSNDNFGFDGPKITFRNFHKYYTENPDEWGFMDCGVAHIPSNTAFGFGWFSNILYMIWKKKEVSNLALNKLKEQYEEK